MYKFFRLNCVCINFKHTAYQIHCIVLCSEVKSITELTEEQHIPTANNGFGCSMKIPDTNTFNQFLKGIRHISNRKRLKDQLSYNYCQGIKKYMGKKISN